MSVFDSSATYLGRVVVLGVESIVIEETRWLARKQYVAPCARVAAVEGDVVRLSESAAQLEAEAFAARVRTATRPSPAA
jgi:hypothetical protein